MSIFSRRSNDNVVPTEIELAQPTEPDFADRAPKTTFREVKGPNELKLEYVQVLKTDKAVMEVLTKGIINSYLGGDSVGDGSGHMEYEYITLSDKDKSKVDAAAEKIRALQQLRYDEWQERARAEAAKVEAYMQTEAWLRYK